VGLQLVEDGVGGVVEKVKSIPPIVWLIGAAIIVGWFVLRGGGSTSSVTGSSAGAGGGGGADVTPTDNLSQGLTDLAATVAANAASDAAWRKTIESRLATVPKPANPTAFHNALRFDSWIKSNRPGITHYTPASVSQALRVAGVNAGTDISIGEIRLALQKEHINYGATITQSDVAALFKKTGVTPVTK
jgi:hypothetical protein